MSADPAGAPVYCPLCIAAAGHEVTPESLLGHAETAEEASLLGDAHLAEAHPERNGKLFDPVEPDAYGIPTLLAAALRVIAIYGAGKLGDKGTNGRAAMDDLEQATVMELGAVIASPDVEVILKRSKILAMGLELVSCPTCGDDIGGALDEAMAAQVIEAHAGECPGPPDRPSGIVVP